MGMKSQKEGLYVNTERFTLLSVESDTTLKQLVCVCVCILVTQSCPTLWDPMDCRPPGSSVQGIFQSKILEWVPFPSPGDLPNPGIKPRSPASQADSLPSEPPGKPYTPIKLNNNKKRKSSFEFWICYKFTACLWVKVFLCFRTFISSFWKCCHSIIQSQRSLSRPMILLSISHWGLCLSRKGTQQGARQCVFINTVYIDCYQPRSRNRQNPWLWSFGSTHSPRFSAQAEHWNKLRDFKLNAHTRSPLPGMLIQLVWIGSRHTGAAQVLMVQSRGREPLA